jgi:conjugal transfer pilus assembly protein TraL
MGSPDTRIPATLDHPARVLLWDAGQIGLIVACVFLGVMLRDPVTWIGAGLALAFVYGRLTAGRHRRFLVHLAYWHLPLRLGFVRSPPSSSREFIG